MKHIKKFNESIGDEEEDKRLQPKVKHLIEYLSTLDPEADVYLDHDGWQGSGDTELELVQTSQLFWYTKGDEDKPCLIINN